jgi:penicillin-binding protein 1C
VRRLRAIGLLAVAASSIAAAAFAAVCWSRAELVRVPASFIVLDRQHRFLAQVGGSDARGYGYWPAPATSDRVVAALLALEDRRFWSHPGVDPLAVARAAVQNLSAGRRVSGASSIAMQVARLQRPAPRTFLNKTLEAGTALFLVLRHGREAVLAQYLRLVPFGNSSHGVAHAARFYFDKPAGDLSWAEIALVAAVPQAPTRLNPLDEEGRRRALARGQRVLTHLHERGVVADGDYALARQQLNDLRPAARPRRPIESLHAVARLEELLGGADAWLTRRQEARVVATLDLDVQRLLSRAAEKHVALWRGNGAQQAAIVAVDRASREVLGWVGSAGFFDPAGGAIDFAGVERSPGSTLKPFLYARALDRGLLAPDNVMLDDPAIASGIENADRLYLGRLLPRQALANSRNAPAAALLREIGIDDGYEFLRTLGLHERVKPARHYGLGLAIGAMPTSLERLVRGYGALANDGLLGELVWYRGQETPRSARVMSEAAARQITLFLADPMARLPSFPRMGAAEFAFPVAVKTGTSQDYRDAWTIAYTPRLVVGVWVGRADAGPMLGVSGMRSAARLAQEVVTALHLRDAQPLEDLSFPAPAGHRAVEVCGTGEAARACAPVFREWIAAGEGAGTTPTILVDAATGALATQETPEESIVELPAPALMAWEPGSGRRPPAHPTVRLGILSPVDGTRIIRNPDAPPGADSVALRAAVEGPFRTVSWFVDGELVGTAPAGEVVRWPPRPGKHRVQLRLPGRPEASPPIIITVE